MNYKQKFSPTIADLLIATLLNGRSVKTFYSIIREREFARYKKGSVQVSLSRFGYKMLQQSLWIGPGPLPARFLKCLEELKIRKNIKTFKITKRNNQHY